MFLCRLASDTNNDSFVHSPECSFANRHPNTHSHTSATQNRFVKTWQMNRHFGYVPPPVS